MRTLAIKVYRRYGLDDPTFMNLLTEMNLRKNEVDDGWDMLYAQCLDWLEEHGITQEQLVMLRLAVEDQLANATGWGGDLNALITGLKERRLYGRAIGEYGP